ncbi:MAG: S8 family serine peptidase [Proteobacteria bacterium]|nr:S8 family serine peptidase [Pseudomonadota bacterium]
MKHLLSCLTLLTTALPAFLWASDSSSSSPVHMVAQGDQRASTSRQGEAHLSLPSSSQSDPFLSAGRDPFSTAALFSGPHVSDDRFFSQLNREDFRSSFSPSMDTKPDLFKSLLEPDAPLRNKPPKREGYLIPPLEGVRPILEDHYKSFGIDLQEKPSYLRVRYLMPTVNLAPLTLDLSALNLSFLDPMQDIKALAEKDPADLSEQEIVRLFKHLTSHFLANSTHPAALGALLANPHARGVILSATREEPDLILNAIEGNLTCLRNVVVHTLFSQHEIFTHAINHPSFYQDIGDKESPCARLMTSLVLPFPNNKKLLFRMLEDPTCFGRMQSTADHEGAKHPFAGLVMTAVLFNKPKILDFLFARHEIVSALRSSKDEKDRDTLMWALGCAVVLDKRDVTKSFYKSAAIFQHLVSHIVDEVTKVNVNIGLLMSLSARAAQDIDALTHPAVMAFLREDQTLANFALKKSMGEHNTYLMRALISDENFPMSDQHLLKMIKIPALWLSLTPDVQGALLTRLQGSTPALTRESLEATHKAVTAREVLATGRPHLAPALEEASPDLAARFAVLVQRLSDPRLSQEERIALYREKVELLTQTEDLLSPVHTPWSHADVNGAHAQGLFGQGVRVLVTEPDAMGEEQREGLLAQHLTLHTHFVRKRGSSHNTGVSSIVAQVAPCAQITSTPTKDVKRFGEDLKNGAFSFINCSWVAGVDNPEKKDISIFGHHKELTDLLGQTHAVLIQAAGNQMCDLSHPAPNADPIGIVCVRLLEKLSPADFENLILAVNVNAHGRVADSSNIPGRNEHFWRNTLGAQGCATYWVDETGNSYRPLKDGGTSSAAPLITAAAALVQSYKPDFSPVMVKKCLLHSAVRDFLAPAHKGEREEWVYETHQNPAFEAQRRFDSRYYGMGILNVTKALRFADRLEETLNSRAPGAPAMTFESFEALRERVPYAPTMRASSSSIDRETAGPNCS